MDTYDGIGAPPYSPMMLLSLVVFAYINGVYSCRGIIATENQYLTNFALYHNPTDTLTFKPFLDKYKKRHGKLSKSVTADSGYGSEENYEYLEMEEMVGYVKYNWFHKEQHKPFKEDAFNQANFYYNKDDDYYVCPMGQHMEPCGQRQTKRMHIKRKPSCY